MKYRKNKIIKYLVSLIFLCSFSGQSLAASLMTPSHRQDRWEMSFITRYVDSKTVDFNGGAQATLNDEFGWAFGFGYNYTEHWAFNFDIGWDNVGYAGTRIDDNGVPQTVSGTLRTSNVNFSGIYNFSAKRFTPFVGASIGWVFVDTNIPTGPPGTICWWDPWWGYICSGYQPTKTSTDLTYGATIGLRFDVKDNLFFRGSIGKSWADFSKTTSTPDFDVIRFDVGFMFF